MIRHESEDVGEERTPLEEEKIRAALERSPQIDAAGPSCFGWEHRHTITAGGELGQHLPARSRANDRAVSMDTNNVSFTNSQRNIRRHVETTLLAGAAIHRTLIVARTAQLQALPHQGRSGGSRELQDRHLEIAMTQGRPHGGVHGAKLEVVDVRLLPQKGGGQVEGA